MKHYIIILIMCIGFLSNAQEKSILKYTINLDEVLVKATRLDEKAPFTLSNISKEEIEEIVESIVEEKMEEISKDSKKIVDWKDKTDDKLSKIEQQITDLKSIKYI